MSYMSKDKSSSPTAHENDITATIRDVIKAGKVKTTFHYKMRISNGLNLAERFVDKASLIF